MPIFLALSTWISSADSRFINYFMRPSDVKLFENFAESVDLGTWEQAAGMIVRWYAIAIVSFVVVWAIWVFSGSNAFNMVTNMIIGVSGIIAIIIVFEVLKRKIKVSE